jgi:hypothetical protein
MKKLAILLSIMAILFSGCSMFSSKQKMKEYIEKLETSLKNDSIQYAQTLDILKSEMQHQIDSINAACGQPKGNYHIITGSFREQQNAVNFVAEMQKMGYSASIIDAPNGFHLVSVSAGNNLQQMFATLNNIRSSVNEESWIYIKN